ncbi:MAG: UvrD-helicase domain-containing protein [Candidatus Blackburnbacteria bacterium]|nr:UvrD-helicase domain-containing protein [Candidatus Blackburnbacteria bacterium]
MVKKVLLNSAQEEAVLWGDGPLLIIAGAGTGKTTVVTERIKHLILNQGVLPSEILALTFTEKAAKEMQERVDVAMPYGYTQMWISTFHSFGDRILKNDGVQIGLDPRYRVMTEAEAIAFLRKHIFDFDLSYFRPLGNPTKFLSGIFQHFSRLQDEDIDPAQYLDWARMTNDKCPMSNVPGKKEADKWVELAKAYAKYEELKNKEGLADFSDLICNTLRLFRQRPNVLEAYKKAFKYILVDEFQDTNIAQNELIRLLAGDQANLTVVADDDQSIYKWRGAAISNVIQFRAIYPKAKIIALTENYRSTQKILDTAYTLIQFNNPDRLEVQEKIDKHLKSSRKDVGDASEFIHADRVENEAEMVAKKINHLVGEEKRKYSDFAILVRANNHAEPFVRALARAGIPYQFLGPGQLFRQAEIKEIFCYLKVLANFEDSAAFYKVLTMEHLGFSPRDIASLVNYSRRNNLSLFEATEKIDDISVKSETREKVKNLVEMINRHIQLIPKETAGQILYYFFQDSGLLDHIVNPKNPTDEKRAQNIARFFDKLKSYEGEHEDGSVFAVVDWIELSLDLGESPLASDMDWASENAVNILTIHASKGLEFPAVFVVNMVDARFPTRERREQIPIPEELIKEVLPEGNHHLQEERRLAYVAATRAKDRLYFTAADYYGEGKREKKISLFVPEALGEDILNTTTTKGEQLSILEYLPLPVALSDDPKPRTIPPITYLSYSQIDCFRFCPLHYKMKYILRIPTPTSPAQSFGISLHNTMKDFHELGKGGNPLGEKEILEIYERDWVRSGYLSKSHEQKTKEQGKEYLVEYLKTDLHNPKNLPIDLEKSFIFPLVPGLKLGGKIDRIDKTLDGGIEIIDYKTTDLETKGPPTKRDLEKDLQLSFYALAAAEVRDPVFAVDTDKITLSLYFFNKALKVSTTRTKKQLEQAKQEILKAKQEIETSDFSCSGNLWCKECEFKLFCEST